LSDLAWKKKSSFLPWTHSSTKINWIKLRMSSWKDMMNHRKKKNKLRSKKKSKSDLN
jgi:hypothetical protein